MPKTPKAAEDTIGDILNDLEALVVMQRTTPERANMLRDIGTHVNPQYELKEAYLRAWEWVINRRRSPANALALQWFRDASLQEMTPADKRRHRAALVLVKEKRK